MQQQLAGELRVRFGCATAPSRDRRLQACDAPRGAAEEDGLSLGAKELTLQERLIATEQAIQLDELIKWVRAQGTVAVSAPEKD